MPTWREAKLVVDAIISQMRPLCERIEVAGSIRRLKPVVKDLEIVCIAKWEEFQLPGSMFPEGHSRVFEWASQGAKYQHPIIPFHIKSDPASYVPGSTLSSLEYQEKGIQWIKPATDEVIPWQVKEEGNYYRGILEDETKLDLFITTPECWGCIYLIRTGSKEFNKALLNHARFQRGTPLDQGRILNYGRPVDRIKEEEDVFEYLGLEYIKPEHRTGAEALKVKR